MKLSLLGTLVLSLAVAAPALAQGLTVGDKLTPFKLPQAAGPEFDLASLSGKKAVVILFIATQCPVSNAYNERMAALARDYSSKGVVFIGINSNKQESAAEVVEHAKTHGFDFALLKDAGNVQADRFGAHVTPEAYVFDGAWTLRYHGRVDEDRSGRNVTSPDLRNALDALLAGREIAVKETKAFGCTIKRVDKATGA
jgi:peroxiredoxin